MSSRTIHFNAEDLIQLLVHYTDGRVPLDTTLKTVGVSQFLQRWIGLEVASAQWSDGTPVPGGDGISPLHIRYEGKKVLKLGKRDAQPIWTDAPDAPTRQ